MSDNSKENTDRKTKGQQERIRICILGASFGTSNLGVSALADSVLKLSRIRWREAEICFLGSDQSAVRYRVRINGEDDCIDSFPIRFCKNIFTREHFVWYLVFGVLAKLLPLRVVLKLIKRHEGVKRLLRADLVVDITGGDSFSDIYGIRRFILGFLRKWLVLFYGKRLIMLPQTYGPFKRRTTRMLAKYILKRVDKIYSRDRKGLDVVRRLLRDECVDGKLRVSPDVAFALDVHQPEKKADALFDILKQPSRESVLVGLNISGLLYNGGYNRRNMFGLSVDYPGLVYELSRHLLKDERVRVLLVPHVFTSAGNESDVEACRKINGKLTLDYPGRVSVVEGPYNQNEIKYIIGQCDFFIGSRMHSCIAALSQCVPAVGLAYSDKFKGVFETVGTERFVIDLRRTSRDKVIGIVEDALTEREQISNQLETLVPEVKSKTMNLFSEVNV